MNNALTRCQRFYKGSIYQEQKLMKRLIAPFAGLGVMAAIKYGFISISAPTLLSKTNLFIPTRKPINLMVGYRIGSSREYCHKHQCSGRI